MHIRPIFSNPVANNYKPHFQCKDRKNAHGSDYGNIDHDNSLRQVNEKYAGIRAVLAHMLENGDIKSIGEYTQAMDTVNSKEQAETLKAYEKIKSNSHNY